LVEIHELQAELYVFKTRGIANFGTRCRYVRFKMPKISMKVVWIIPGIGKFVVFKKIFAVTRKWYKIGIYLLHRVNRTFCVLLQTQAVTP